MTPVDAHLKRVLGELHPLPELELRLLDAHGCVLAEDVVAEGPLPAHDTATVDGYAVRAADVAAATAEAPVSLHVVADVPVGQVPTVVVQQALAVRVRAGSVVPRGTEAVVPAAYTDGGIAHVRVARPVPAGAYVRRAGDDVAAGTPVLSRSALVNAPQVALLAAVGRRNVLARPRPRVVVVASGADLAGEAAVRDASGTAIAAAVREAGGVAYHAGVVAEDPREFANVVEDHLIQADLVVVTGSGIDAVSRDVLPRLGEVTFEDLAMEPAGVHGFGRIGPDGTPVFALPGGAVASLVAFEVFVRPALRRMLGSETLGRPHVSAVATRSFASAPGRRDFVRARVERSADRWVVTPVAPHLAGFAAANALTIVPEDVSEVAEGTPLLTWLLERRGV
ncbi:MAG TPA: gephyrin-like molybdotransferase Glp [Frankiaceae bacterium]|nr:gephyrin-like molybdotransferase Glp [Frankiaceae bacterium]